MRNVRQFEIDALAIRQEKRIVTVKAEQYDPDFAPGQLQEFVLWSNALLDEIPEEFRATAEIEISSTSSYYDSHYATIEVTYRRPETDEEWEARKQDVAARMQEEKQRELNLLAQLQAKYGA